MLLQLGPERESIINRINLEKKSFSPSSSSLPRSTRSWNCWGIETTSDASWLFRGVLMSVAFFFFSSFLSDDFFVLYQTDCIGFVQTQTSLVLLTPNFPLTLSSLVPQLSFHSQLCTPNNPPSFTLPTILTPLDTSTLNYLANTPNPTSTRPRPRPLFQTPSVQLLKLPWKDASFIRSVGSLVAGLLCGKVVGEERSAVQGEWGMWDGEQERWDEEALREITGDVGIEEEELRRKLGEVDLDGGGGKVVSRYLVERFGFSRECVVTGCESFSLSLSLSLLCFVSQQPRTITRILTFISLLLSKTNSHNKSSRLVPLLATRSGRRRSHPRHHRRLAHPFERSSNKLPLSNLSSSCSGAWGNASLDRRRLDEERGER